jgi:hypothetical protein
LIWSSQHRTYQFDRKSCSAFQGYNGKLAEFDFYCKKLQMLSSQGFWRGMVGDKGSSVGRQSPCIDREFEIN